MPRHVVVDGSNIATEGRAMPSLKQLNDAVLAFIDEYPNDLVTVVVDATFGHRIDQSELAEFDAAVENNELVSPPAGAIGRGDAFVLTIANKANATVLSNDSFQEFHGDYPWLFDDGRLIGGKPVPHVGWVFVHRAPVRGPVSRKAVRARKGGRGATKAGAVRPSKLASEPMPTPKVPPPAKRGHRPSERPAERSADERVAAASTAPAKAVAGAEAPSGAAKHAAINELLPFLGFVEHHPVGSAVEAEVESYSSHGTYVRVGDVRAYVPLRYLADPAPRSAREVLAIGERATFVVVSFNAPRRGIDLALAGHEPAEVKAAAAALAAAAQPAGKAPAKKAKAPAKRAAKKAAAEPSTVAVPGVAATAAERVAPEAGVVEPAPAPTKKAAKKAAKAPAKKAVKKAASKAAAAAPAPAPAKTAAKAPAKRATKKAAAPVSEVHALPSAAAKAPIKRARKTAAAAASEG